MFERRRPYAPALAALFVLLTAASASATPDHLLCRRASETGPRTTYSADLVSAAYAGTGCTIKAPAKEYCEEATVSNLSPPAPFPQLHGAGGPGRFLCYRLKCPKELDTVTITDLLGTHVTKVTAPKTLCVPEIANFSACPGPGADCNTCMAGCAAHSDPAPPANVCVNPSSCSSPGCTADIDCVSGSACVLDPTNPPQTICCPSCAN